MIDKQKIIFDMCMSYRHDFGLRKEPNDPPWTAGMTPEERKGLYNTMAQIYDNNIAPIMEIKNDKSS